MMVESERAQELKAEVERCKTRLIADAHRLLDAWISNSVLSKQMHSAMRNLETTLHDLEDAERQYLSGWEE